MMNKDWPIQERLPIGEENRLDFQETLVFYEGPQVGIVQFRDAPHLAIAADEDTENGLIRWLLANVSDTDILAIKTGAQTLRETIEADENVTIVDTDGDLQITKTYEAAVSELSDMCLPDRGAFLPDGICEAHRKKLEHSNPTIRIEGESIRRHSVPFRIASDILGNLQRLWNAFAQVAQDDEEITRQGAVPAELRERAKLSLVAISEGSAKLDIHAGDSGLHQEISGLFEQLVRSRVDAENIHKQLDEYGPRVESAFSGLVKSVQRNEVSVLAAARTTTAYLTPASSSKVKRLLEAHEAATKTRKIHGYFVAFDLETRSFKFREADTGDEFEGNVSLEVAEDIDELSLGKPKKYEVEVEITRDISPTNKEKGQDIRMTRLTEDI